MNNSALRTWFSPTIAGIVCLVLLLFGYVAATISGGITFWSEMDRKYWTIGYPNVVERLPRTLPDGVTLDSADPDIKLTVHWFNLFVVLLVAYVIAMPLGRLVTGGWGRLVDAPMRTGWRRAGIVLMIVCGATLVPAFVAAMICSKLYWGYYLSPPRLDHRVRTATKLESFTFFTTARTPSDQPVLVHDPRSELDADTIAYARASSGSSFGIRGVAAMVERRLLPPIPRTMPHDRLASLHALLDGANLLEAGNAEYYKSMPPGYVSRAKHLHGYVMELRGAAAEPLMFISAQTGEVDNDHYASYEFLCANVNQPAQTKLLASQRIYRDSAGIEGLEWPAMFAIFYVLGLAVTVPITILVMIVRRLIERARLPGRGFPVELVGV